MKKNKLIVFSTIAVGMLGLFLFIKLTNYPVFSSEIGVSVTEQYSQVTELEEQSQVIVDGKVLETKSFMYEDMPFTLSKVQVEEAFKGKFEKGDVINLLETGGVIKNTEFSVENNENMKEDTHALLYLYAYEGPIESDVEKYVVTGLYQGKYTHEENSENLNSSEGNIGELSEITEISDLELPNEETAN